MDINELLKSKNMTKYRLSKISGIPFATISDITTGKTSLPKCNAETLYKLAKALEVTMEEMIAGSVEYRRSFESYKSYVCHQVKDMGDIDFIIDTLESGRIRELYKRQWYPESLYLLAMLDYLSRENDLPICIEYDDIRSVRLQQTIYPAGIIAMSSVSHSEKPKRDSYAKAIAEFKRFNIVESEIRNVV